MVADSLIESIIGSATANILILFDFALKSTIGGEINE